MKHSYAESGSTFVKVLLSDLDQMKDQIASVRSLSFFEELNSAIFHKCHGGVFAKAFNLVCGDKNFAAEIIKAA